MGVGRDKRRRIFKRDRYRCCYCGFDMTLHFPYPHLGVLTIDHVVPKISGGTERMSNLVTCCFDCNNRKGNRSLDEFLRRVCVNAIPSALRRLGDERQLRWFAARARLAREASASGRSRSFSFWQPDLLDVGAKAPNGTSRSHI